MSKIELWTLVYVNCCNYEAHSAEDAGHIPRSVSGRARLRISRNFTTLCAAKYCIRRLDIYN
jgi:hypothetical protein